ncbi:hypothetical protein FOA52_000300 [Chlamydomonas sp. UWO 241]|nr:hypothetical protein FOA52_000300 [Chlamydomonas sp. UWO 241]
MQQQGGWACRREWLCKETWAWVPTGLHRLVHAWAACSLQQQPANMASAGQVQAKEQAKAAQREKEYAARDKKEAGREKQWAQGARDTSAEQAEAEKAAQLARVKAEKAAQLAAEGGAPAAVNPNKAIAKTCKECGTMQIPNAKKGCPGCFAKIMAANAPKKGKK